MERGEKIGDLTNYAHLVHCIIDTMSLMELIGNKKNKMDVDWIVWAHRDCNAAKNLWDEVVNTSTI